MESHKYMTQKALRLEKKIVFWDLTGREVNSKEGEKRKYWTNKGCPVTQISLW